MSKPKLEKDENGFGQSMILNTSWSDEYASYARSKLVESLRLSFANGWKDTDLSFLKGLSFFKNLELSQFLGTG